MDDLDPASHTRAAVLAELSDQARRCGRKEQAERFLLLAWLAYDEHEPDEANWAVADLLFGDQVVHASGTPGAQIIPILRHSPQPAGNWAGAQGDSGALRQASRYSMTPHRSRSGRA